ncbi:MAG: ABC transporter ATP-binding protein [Aquaticitalea sp.]
MRFRIFIVLLLSILVGLLDGLGLTMFLPLLKIADGSADASTDNLGKLSLVVDSLSNLGIELSLFTILLFMFIFFSLKGVANYYSNYYKLVVSQYFIKLMRINMLTDLSRYSYKLFVKADTGKIQNALTSEIIRVSNSYSTYFSSLQNLIMILVYMIFAFLVDWKFAFLITIGGLFTNVLFKGIYKKTKGLSSNVTILGNGYQKLLIQFVHNFKYLKATGSTHKYARKLKQTVNEIEQNHLLINVLGIRLTSLREPLLIAVVCSVIMLQVYVLNGNLNSVLLSLLFFYRALSSLMSMQTSYNSFLALSGSLHNIVSFEDDLKAGKEKDGTIILSEFNTSIQLNNLVFGYDINSNILKGISLTLSKNKTIAFVGESGSGKTTLINVISGLLKPTKGEVVIDDIDIENIQMHSYQIRIGYISQEPVIFNDTVYNNITMWDEENPQNMARYLKAIKQASISNFIEDLKDKDASILGYNGINLSGGQRQRISIARELYKDIDILILDEATSALDSETENDIQMNIDELKGDYTILIIAHRLSTIKNADIIVVLDKGIIESQGSFDELLISNKRFKQMVTLQEF